MNKYNIIETIAQYLEKQKINGIEFGVSYTNIKSPTQNNLNYINLICSEEVFDRVTEGERQEYLSTFDVEIQMYLKSSEAHSDFQLTEISINDIISIIMRTPNILSIVGVDDWVRVESTTIATESIQKVKTAALKATINLSITYKRVFNGS